MAIWKKVNADELVGFECGDVYTSKLLTGDEMAGQPVININQGTLKPFSRTAGGVHEKTEIYYMVDVGEGSLVVLDDEAVAVKNGDIIVIPGGVFHWIDNRNCEKPFILFTLWPNQAENEVYHLRLKEWGVSMKYIETEKTV